MPAGVDRGGSFGHGSAPPCAGVPRNWMRAPAPGIALRRDPAESSPVGGGSATSKTGRRDRGNALAWIAAAGLGLALWLTRGHVG